MGWSEIASIVAACIAAAALADRIISRLMRGQYITRDQLLAVERAWKDELMLEGKMRSDLATSVRVMEADIKHLPTTDDMAEIKDKMAKLSEDLAVSAVVQEATQNEVKQVHRSIEGLRDEIREQNRGGH